MDVILGLKVSFIICTPTTTFFLKSLHAKKNVIFISEFGNFGKNPPLYDFFF